MNDALVRSAAARRRRQLHRQGGRGTRMAIVLGLIALIVGVGAAVAYDQLKQDAEGPLIPSVDNVDPKRIGENSVIYDSRGNRMGVIQADQHRTVIDLKDMGEWLPKAAVAIEDRRYYDHPGVDPEGIVRAGVRNFEAGGVREGASTITQQVVRNLFKEITQEKTFSRKFKEAVLAAKLEQKWTREYGKREAKRRILEMYLNIVFFGNNAYGAEAAADTYFSKHAKDLTLPEAALLAGLPQKPSEFDPYVPARAKEALARRNDVLKAMLSQRMINQQQYDEALATEIELNPGETYQQRELPYFFDFVEKELIAKFKDVNVVRNGGLRIHTTIDPGLQNLAQRAINETFTSEYDPEAAIVVLDTKSGEVKAMASSTDYSASKFNIAAQGKRQPGSSAKTWVLAAFVKEGVDPENTSYTSRPLKVRPLGSTEWWEPKTYDGSYAGTQSISSATIRSDNSVYAQMTMDIGPEKVAETAHELGIRSKLEPFWSIGLGSQVVTPLEQTNVYSTIARGGVRIDPTGVSRVTNAAGSAVKLKKPRQKRVLKDFQARAIIDILERNMDYGTGTGANIARAASGKTGTTDDHKDAWFCGMTPELTACVWVGHIVPTPIPGLTGGSYPATIWRRFMEPALENKPQSEWFTPASPEVWLPFSSNWQDDPGIETSYLSTPSTTYRPSTDSDSESESKTRKEDAPGAGEGTEEAPAEETAPTADEPAAPTDPAVAPTEPAPDPAAAPAPAAAVP